MKTARRDRILTSTMIMLYASGVAILVVVWMCAKGAWFVAIPFGLYTLVMIYSSASICWQLEGDAADRIRKAHEFRRLMRILDPGADTHSRWDGN